MNKPRYHFQIFRLRAEDTRKTCWFEDTEYGITETVELVKGIVAALTDKTNPVVEIRIRKV